MNEPTIIGPALLDQIWQQARESPRKRKNYNFHLRESDPANRLLNAVEPESYVRPHRHKDPAKDETIIAVRGSFGVVFFEAKAGPYVPVSMAEFAPWAPAEGDPGAHAYLEKLRGLFDFQLAD